MEKKDILIALADIEANLQSIDSAKQQVEATISSCQQIGKTANQYSTALGKIALTIEQIITSIKQSKELIESEAKDILEAFKKKSADTIEIEQKELHRISVKFATDCKEVVDTAKDELKKQTDSIDSILTSKTLELNSLISNLNSEIVRLESLYTLLNTTLEEISTLKGTVNQLQIELTSSQSKQEEKLSSIKSQIEDFIADVKIQLTSLQNELTASQNAQDEVLKKISTALHNSARQAKVHNNDVVSTLNKKFEEMQSAGKTNRIILSVCLICLFFSIVLLLVK